ncbi:MAG: DUF4118 domain-containing protein, partial [Acidobacteria bacterium]|nr:DUF4118 domain-containing protein [Acidobacteriota bacterium]
MRWPGAGGSTRIPTLDLGDRAGHHQQACGALLLSLAATAALTAIYSVWLGVTNPTIVALSFLLIVLVVAAVSRRWVAISTSFAAFLCFNLFFLPPVGTLAIADPAHWVALFTLLAVSVVASHLSAQARHRTDEAT